MSTASSIVLSLALCATLTATLTCAGIDSEIQALLSFKQNLYDPRGAMDGWDVSTPAAPCDWRGILCYTGRVRELRLPRLQLSGRLSDQLGNLRQLRRLSLHSNNLNGSIPRALSECSLLRAVYLQYNSLAGEISPAFFSNLTNLQVLNLAHNLISGEISRDISASMRILDLSSNSFSGEIPGNFSAAHQLQLINFSFNRFSGEIPGTIGALQQLAYLWLDGNRLYGTIPSAISNCSSLIHVSAGDNMLSGVVPATMGSLKNLQVISLPHNQLTGVVSSSLLCNISVLNATIRILNLSFNALTGIENNDGEMCDSVLEVLDVHENQINGVFPNLLMNFSTLKILDISGNLISGMLPENVGILVVLEEFRVGNNSLTGEIPESVTKCGVLRVLDLGKNRFSGLIPEFLGEMKNLTMLILGGNLFTGLVPVSIGSLYSLEVLDLSDNKLSGTVPVELMRLTNLSTLNLSNNRFSNQRLDLGQNSLTGAIPESISNCSSLVILLLDSNHITGRIPDTLSKISKLTELDVSSNNLTGDIPANLSLIPVLQHLNLSANNLEGEIPEALASRFSDPSVYAMNKNLCGRPLKKNCKNVKRRKRKRLILLIVVAAAGSLMLLLCCCGYIYSLLRWRKKLRAGAAGEKKRSPSPGSQGARGSGENGAPKLVMFNNKITYAETVEATRQFDEENVLSRGKYGLLFKATYADGMVLAIRRLPDTSIEENTFRKEAESLGKVKHRNLTVLRGYYAGPPPDMRLLVYDYMPNGNLGTLLQEASHQEGHVLNWPMRHLIALGIARGLAFLHSVSIIHGDVKPQNVLFDADFEAHLSDFGLDKLTIATPAEASTSAMPIGTLGYVAPEATLTGQPTKEVDVYSFGIVVLEILTGKKPVMFTQDEDIVKWVKRQLQRGQVSELLEPGLLELDPESSEWEEFLLGVKVGLLCTMPDPLERPSMTDVVFMLEGCRLGPEIPSSADPTTLPSPT
ncbi:hypothetical protein Pfo_021542 [Paulownia fortunei]|nr:hypothetical protein Pfo_021542 [Paulownia fortunei]